MTQDPMLVADELKARLVLRAQECRGCDLIDTAQHFDQAIDRIAKLEASLATARENFAAEMVLRVSMTGILDQARKDLSTKTAEIARLTRHLGNANANCEHFERQWYLVDDQLEKAREAGDEMADKLHILKCESRDELSRQAADRAIALWTAALEQPATPREDNSNEK